MSAGKKNIATIWSIFYFDWTFQEDFPISDLALQEEEAKTVLEEKESPSDLVSTLVTRLNKPLLRPKPIFIQLQRVLRKKCTARSTMSTALNTIVLSLFSIQGERYDQVAADVNSTPWRFIQGDQRLAGAHRFLKQDTCDISQEVLGNYMRGRERCSVLQH